MRYKNRIKNIPKDLRPREKLQRLGAQNLADEELLAIILGSGTKDKDVITLSKELIEVGWKNLESMELSELTKVKGLGKVKAIQLKALIELSKRIVHPDRRKKISSPQDVYELVKDMFSEYKESLVCLYLDLGNRVVHIETVAVGTLNRVFSQPRDILKPAVECSAYGIIMVHNHPQGILVPSEEDIAFTRRVRDACELLGFELLDHLILNGEGFISLRETGKLD